MLHVMEFTFRAMFFFSLYFIDSFKLLTAFGYTGKLLYCYEQWLLNHLDFLRMKLLLRSCVQHTYCIRVQVLVPVSAEPKSCNLHALQARLYGDTFFKSVWKLVNIFWLCRQERKAVNAFLQERHIIDAFKLSFRPCVLSPCLRLCQADLWRRHGSCLHHCQQRR